MRNKKWEKDSEVGKMAELQLPKQQGTGVRFVIDDILEDDEEISLDDTNPELQLLF